MQNYHRKLYALLWDGRISENADRLCQDLQCLCPYLSDLQTWWKKVESQVEAIAKSSDCVNLKDDTVSQGATKCKHPISGQSQPVSDLTELSGDNISDIRREQDVEKVFWWFWRFYPERQAQDWTDALLFPAHKILPDCPQFSYRSTVSALTGAMFANGGAEAEHPYILLFSFSPVQEFIKASRKFLDFWAGSYLLHYLSAQLCWHVAQEYGPDAVITPSLWSQEIMDALLLQKYPDFETYFRQLPGGGTPVSRFSNKVSTSLSTAGFPNVITVLVPGQKGAEKLGQSLAQKLQDLWMAIGQKVKENVKRQVIQHLSDNDKLLKLWDAIASEFFPDNNQEALNSCKQDVKKWQQPGCWEWNKLWDAQLSHTWETYWTAVPLGHPDQPLEIQKEQKQCKFDESWKQAQEFIAPSRHHQSIPTTAEEKAYTTLNVGTWWGNVQSRLGQLLQSVKNTRTWQIPTAPGERSTLSGQFSAVHPNLLYNDRFREGGGLSNGSMRLFWRIMAEVYPGLFNGSEKLNALELTKRMAWGYGGVAESLGIESRSIDEEIDYEGLIRFPNISSIAAARFAYEQPDKVQDYWHTLDHLLKKAQNQDGNKIFSNEEIKAFCSKTRRPFQAYNTDTHIKQKLPKSGNGYNGVMFSHKWLAEDMGLPSDGVKIPTLRECVDKAHQDSGFENSSPADWWVIVLADGDNMGQYVSGAKLKNYECYINSELTSNPIDGWDKLATTKKRMGPATHVGLNRALLDFSNRLVPYITERRCCGKVVYSGGDDVMAVLPLADLPEFLRSIRAAWCGGKDPVDEFSSKGGYWHPKQNTPIKPHRPHFTMGEGATMSMGIVIAYKSVPLPTVLESLWTAEKDRAKKLPAKDGLCFRVIYGSGNTLEALMKGHLLESWWQFIQEHTKTGLSSLLYRLAEELPKHASIQANQQLCQKVARVVLMAREQKLSSTTEAALLDWLNQWEDWAYQAQQQLGQQALGAQEADLAMLLRFSAFWVDKMVEQDLWTQEDSDALVCH